MIKKEKTKLRVIGCYWYLDGTYTHPLYNSSFHLFSVSGALHFFSFFFLLWSGEKTHIGNEKEKCSTDDLLLLSFSCLLPQTREFVCHHSFLLSDIFHFQFVLGWRRTIELSIQYLFIIIARFLLSRFIWFYPKPVTIGCGCVSFFVCVREREKNW